MKKRRILIAILLSLCAACLFFALSGCSNFKSNHSSNNNATVIRIDGAKINNREITLEVNFDVSSVSLDDKVICNSNYTWKLYRDIAGQQEIPTKIASNLRDGNNQFYIVLTNQNDTESKTYTLNIYRNHEVKIYYAINDWRYIQIHEETATTNTELKITYTIESQWEEKSIEDYSDVDVIMAWNHFNFWKDEQGNRVDTLFLDPDNHTSPPFDSEIYLQADLTPKTRKIILNPNEGSAIDNPISITFRQESTLPIPTKKDYAFAGWYSNDNRITDSDGKIIDYNDSWKILLSVDTLYARWQISPDHPAMQNSYLSELPNGEYAIRGLKNNSLTEIVVPSFITKINPGAFSRCSRLAKLTLPFTIPFMGSIFGREWYSGSTGIQENGSYYYIPASLTSICITGTEIANYAFENFEILEINGANVTTVGEYAFSNCTTLKRVKLPNLVSIKEGAFKSCENLTEIIFSESLKNEFELPQKTVVYYLGTREIWKNYQSWQNLTVYFYSEHEPDLNETGTAYQDNYWFYSFDGTPKKWIL